ncbi:hypothetical protein HG531_003340 [Fusarium graminearum]|nr:hypothetical protein HG531_003340 [Fusarium graminearum]
MAGWTIVLLTGQYTQRISITDKDSPDVFALIRVRWAICRSRADDNIGTLITAGLDLCQGCLGLSLAVSEIAQVLEISFWDFCDVATTEDTDLEVLNLAFGFGGLHASSLQSVLAVKVLEDDLVSTDIVGNFLCSSTMGNQIF